MWFVNKLPTAATKKPNLSRNNTEEHRAEDGFVPANSRSCKTRKSRGFFLTAWDEIHTINVTMRCVYFLFAFNWILKFVQNKTYFLSFYFSILWGGDTKSNIHIWGVVTSECELETFLTQSDCNDNVTYTIQIKQGGSFHLSMPLHLKSISLRSS